MPNKVVADIPTLNICHNERIIVSFPSDYTLSQCFEYLSTITQHYPNHGIKDIVLKWRFGATNLWCATLILTQPMCHGKTHSAEVLFDETKDSH